MDVIRKLIDVDKAYIAGFIDGEGCIYFNRQGQRYLLKLDIKNANEKILDWLRYTTGFGSKRILKPRENRQPCWEWRLTSNQAIQLLKEIKQFIQVKIDQVELALEYQKLPVSERLVRGEEYHGKMKAMHLPTLRKVAATLPHPVIANS